MQEGDFVNPTIGKFIFRSSHSMLPFDLAISSRDPSASRRQ
jgi:hypothetical protein